MNAPRRPDDVRRIIREGCALLHIEISERAIDRLERFIALVSEWRDRADLTSVSDPAEMAVRHLLDSLIVLLVMPPPRPLTVIDVGTGAGFPGFPLAATDYGLHVTLLDRDPRKIVFLKLAASSVDMRGLTFINAAVDDFLGDPDRRAYDVVVSRAFTSDLLTLKRSAGLLKPDGSLIRMLGPSQDPSPFPLSDFKIVDRWENYLPFSSRYRRILRYKRRD